MRGRSLLVTSFGVLLAFGLGASAAQAQFGIPGAGTPFPGGRGRGGMGRGGPRWDGGAMPEIPDLSNPVRIILQHRADLQLDDVRAQRVDSVARALDRQNDTLVAVVRRALGEDSTRAGEPGADRERRPRDVGEAVALRDRLNAVQPIVKQIRKNDDAAWKSAVALLTDGQRKQAEKIRKDEQKEIQKERGRWRDGAGGRGRYPG